MRTWKAILHCGSAGIDERGRTASGGSQPSAQPPAPDATQTRNPLSRLPRQRISQPPQAAGRQRTAARAAAPAPTTMDQVVNLFIEREHGLIKVLSNRTPVVETYLQNLTADPQLGPVPSADHYFLGRMDMGETVDRKDYLKEEDTEHADPSDGRLPKLYKVQYQPLGFSWMVYADRTDFDREHYDFRYARREFLGDVRCLVFDVTPKTEIRPWPLPGPHLGGRSGLQHRAPERNLLSGAAQHSCSSTWTAGA